MHHLDPSLSHTHVADHSHSHGLGVDHDHNHPHRQNPLDRSHSQADHLSIRDKKKSRERQRASHVHELPDAKDKEKKEWYATHPTDLPMSIKIIEMLVLPWEIFVYFAVMLHNIALVFGVFFTYYNETVWDILWAGDLIFAIDVCLRLTVEIWRNLGQHEVVIFDEPYRFGRCLLDIFTLLPCVPIIILSMYGEKGIHEMEFAEVTKIEHLKLNGFARLYRAVAFYSVLKDRRIISDEFHFLLVFFTGYVKFIEAVGAAFIVLTGIDPVHFMLWKSVTKVDKSWVKNFRNKKPGYGQEPFDMFVLSMHFSTATVTTVGYGDLHGENELEMIFAVIVMLVGAIFLNGYFTSQMTNFLLELDSARFELFYRLEGIVKFLEEAGTKVFFRAKVQNYYKCLWTYREGVDYVQFFERIPRSMQEDIRYDICLEMFHKSYLFRGLDEAFLRAVSKVVRISMYTPEMILCRSGGYANRMFYILQGECQAMSKHESSKKAAILRAGSIIGETNLFFSCPYTISVETHTPCQFIIVDKEELMNVFDNFPSELTIFRNRTQKQIAEIYTKFKLYGKDPICWVRRNEPELKARHGTRDPKVLSKDVIGRWNDGINLVVTDDVILDFDRCIIFETLCRNRKYKKNHVAPYITGVVPEILNTNIAWIRYWNYTIMVLALLYGLLAPYCYTFGAASPFQQHMCEANKEYFQWINELCYLVDIFVEILGACPVEGLYFKLKDGLQVKRGQILFYLDCIAGVPFQIFKTGHPHDLSHSLNIIVKSLKLWKVIRYLRNMDNVYPKQLFWFRLGQTLLVLLYGTHFIACIMFFMACPTVEKTNSSVANENKDKFECIDHGWIASYQTDREINDQPIPPELVPTALARWGPYLLSFHFSAATLTSAGFGDFSPQNIAEMILTITFQLLGFFLIGYYTSELTSALTCVVNPRVVFQQKLIAVRRFMSHYALPQALQRRIVEHYELQHQINHGITLPYGEAHFLFDAPDYIKDDALYTDMVLLLDGVPLFSKMESKQVTRLADRMKRYLIPPNVTFLMLGEVRRTLYILRHGSIGIFDGTSDVPKAIMESSSYFALRDLMFGEPSHFDHLTLSYCVIYEVTYDVFLDVFEDDDELLDYIEILQKEAKPEVEQMGRMYSRLRRGEKKDKAIPVSSWIVFKKPKAHGTEDPDPREEIRYQEYHDYFNEFKGGKFFRFVLMNGVINPVGAFAHGWTCWMSLVACLIICMLIIETFMYLRTPLFRAIQYFLDVFLFVDVYVKMHWGYFLPNGLMVQHPLKTAAVYIFEGSFIYDVLVLAHPEMIMWIFGYTNFLGYGPGATWYTKLRWIRFLQVKRIRLMFNVVHSFFAYRNAILCILYVVMSLFVCTVVAAIATAVGCPWEATDWSEGDEHRLPFCQPNRWAVKKGARLMRGFFHRWTVGVYYVSQVILVIGFGDMITLRAPELYLLIFMSIFGFIFMRCVVSDITAAEVDGDAVRSNYIDQMHRLSIVMKREHVHKKTQKNILDHMKNNWKQSKGLQPVGLFSELHPALEADLFESFVGDRLGRVPLFEGLPHGILHSMCKYLKKYYFLSGERISRWGNLDYHMYIIVSGKVWICDKNLKYICTLRKNETFGESSVLADNVSARHNAIAAENVEVFAISYPDFETILTRYLLVKQLLNLRTDDGAYDFFEFKLHDIDHWLAESTVDIQEQRIVEVGIKTQKIRNKVYEKEFGSLDETEEKLARDLKRERNYIFAWGTEDDNLPVFYFASQNNPSTGKTTNCPPLIHPNCTIMQIFLSLSAHIGLLLSAITMYEVCFPAKDLQLLWNIERVQFPSVQRPTAYVSTVSKYLGWFMLANIPIRFFMPYKDAEGNYVKNSKIVARNYLLRPSGLFLDLVASIPYYIGDHDDDPEGIRPIKYAGLTRILWLYRYVAQHYELKDDLSVSTFRFKITLSVVSFVYLAHVLACGFYTISSCHIQNKTRRLHYLCGATDDEVTWTDEFLANQGIPHDLERLPAEEEYQVFKDFIDPWRWYVRALYWVVTVVSTTGYGDITPQNIPEMIMGIVAIFMGAFILSIILSQFTAGLASIGKAYREYLYQVKLLLKYLNNVGLSALSQEQILVYFETVWMNMEGELYHETTLALPPSIRTEVLYSLFHPVLAEVKFFNTRDKNFLRQISSRLEHSVFSPGVSIVKEGDLGSNMFVVYKGRVAGITEGPNGENQLRNIYKVGDTFGRFPALFFDECYQKTYRASEYAEVLAISQQDILTLTKQNEDFWKILCRYVDNKYDPQGSAQCIFTINFEKEFWAQG